MCSTGSASTSSTAAEPSAVDERVAQDRVQDHRPDAVLAALAAEPAEERDPALVDLVAEPREQRRQDGERAEHRDGDDDHRRDPERQVRLVAGEQHPGHRDHHGQAGDEHRAAGRGCGGLERGPRATCPRPAPHARASSRRASSRRRRRARRAASTALTFGSIGTRWLGSATRPSVAMTAVSASSSGMPGGDERAEDEQQHDQRQRHRPLAGLRELLVERVVQRLAGADRAGLADEEAGVAAGDLAGCGGDRVDPLLGDRRACRACRTRPCAVCPSAETWSALRGASGERRFW